MNRKTSPQNKKAPEITQYKNQKHSIEYQASIKRQSSFFSNWKDRRASIIYIPNQEFSLTLYNKNKNTTDQIINLNLAKVSRRCSVVEQHYCFGLELKSGKRYLLGGPNKAQVLSAFDLIRGLKKLQSQISQLSITSHEKQEKKIKQQKQELEFQRSNDEKQQMSNELKLDQKIKMVSTNYSPLSKTEQREYQRQEDNRQIYAEMQRQSDYCTVLQEEPIYLQQQQKVHLHLKIPLQKEQLEYLESDQNFRLIQNFSQGRILQRNKRIIKANLVFKTHLTSQQLLESFFHLELWNQKVKNYQLKNRIDEGIYLVELQLNKKSMFSSPKHCFMMVTTLIINKEHYLIMKSLERNAFQEKKGTQWLDLALWLKVRGQDNHKMNRLVSLCAAVQNQKDYQQVLAFFLEIKFYQSFLLTTSRLPTRVLQWRKEQENQIFIN